MKRFFLLIIFSLQLYSQNPKKIDSLLKLLKTARHDTTRFNAYMELGNVFQNTNPDTAIYFHTQAEKMAEKIPGSDGELRKGEAIMVKGWDYYVKGDYAKSILHYESSLKIAEKHQVRRDNIIKFKSKRLNAATQSNIGIVYENQGNYQKAMENYFRSLKMYEEIGDKRGQSVSLGNIGAVYYRQGDYSKSMEYYLRSLKLYKEIGDKRGQSVNLGKIGVVYYSQGYYPKALEYYFRALKIKEEIGDKRGLAINLGNIGVVHKEQGDSAFRAGNIRLAAGRYSRSLEYYLRSLKMYEEIGDKRGQAANLGNIGALYLKQKKYKIAEEYLKKAENLNKELGTIYYLKDNYNSLSDLCQQSGRYKEALEYYKEHIKYKDSLMREENQKAAIQKEMQYNFEKEQALKEKEHQKKLELERKEKEKQRIITWFVAAGLVLVVVFLGFVINRLNVTRKQKNIIEKQKKIVEEQKLIVEEQKKLVEQKNKDILDSINYAKRIQNAILPSNVKWKEHLPESFVLYMPKDIVAGDFYWMEYANNFVYVAAADCTGHGVPGAMVSVVCSNALTKAVLEEKLTETDQILNRTRELVIEKLTSEDNIRDGMDICLIRIEKGKNNIQFSGANRPLYIVKSPVAVLVETPAFEIIEIKPDKQPIGRYEESKPFTKQDIELKENTWLYLTTDGYADQFGGDKGKKIGTKQFKELLCDIAAINDPEEQKEKLSSFFQTWKGNEEQMDDVTVIGIKA
ncbi:MAG: tetratricopeptide repeat protein [Bacteroidia bacterium]|nr:tetratricopeptide repeat protein [Bacteroidia bacterium]